jgi:UTP--glucose-1-phosphate uridylyltransferase
MQKIRKAVFPVAGYGTRFLPQTKALPKELLPIIDKPLIQYAVDEAIAAGIDTLIFVTGRNKRAIEDHFDSNIELEMLLRSQGKKQQLKMLQNILPKGIECIFIRQNEQLGLGHAVLCAERAVCNEPFTVLLADDFITDFSSGATTDLIRSYEKSGKSQLSVMEINGPDISRYGVIVPGQGDQVVAGLIEKPRLGRETSNLASIGRYVLTPDIFDILKSQSIGVGGEIQLADAINTQAIENNVEAVVLNGKRFDCGSLEGYVDAFRYMSNNLYAKS